MGDSASSKMSLQLSEEEVMERFGRHKFEFYKFLRTKTFSKLNPYSDGYLKAVRLTGGEARSLLHKYTKRREYRRAKRREKWLIL